MDFDQISRFSEFFWIDFFVKWGKCCGNRTTRAIRMIFGALERNLAELSIFFGLRWILSVKHSPILNTSVASLKINLTRDNINFGSEKWNEFEGRPMIGPVNFSDCFPLQIMWISKRLFYSPYQVLSNLNCSFWSCLQIKQMISAPIYCPPHDWYE